MTYTGKISLAVCVYFPSYSIKCISCFMLKAFGDVIKFEYLTLKYDLLDNEKSLRSEKKNIFPGFISALV